LTQNEQIFALSGFHATAYQSHATRYVPERIALHTNNTMKRITNLFSTNEEKVHATIVFVHATLATTEIFKK